MTAEAVGNAAIEFSRDAYDTSGPTLVGRQAAGESFLRGWLRHARAEQLHIWSTHAGPSEPILDMVRRIGQTERPVSIIPPAALRGVAAAGNLFSPGPSIARDIRLRGSMGAARDYGICGITHTTAPKETIDEIADLLLAPVAPWDRLICTSTAVRLSVETGLAAVRADLVERIGATRLPDIRCETIPLGIDSAVFARRPEERTRWHAELDLPANAMVMLYLGRLNHLAKMNPVPMALALERASRLTRRPIAWIVAGWAPAAIEQAFHATTQRFCPNVHYRQVDGRRSDVRFSIWSAADLFLSLSDNIQETFGLTPLEAMAAGLPVIVSDWDGYRDTVRHGIDGFRIRTTGAPPGMGEDLALRYAADILSYDRYVAAASQLTAVDIGEAAEAIAALANDPDMARTMGAAAQARARADFDWAAVIPRYEAMWAEMTAERTSAQGASGRVPDPRRLDPFRTFASYPSAALSAGSTVALSGGPDLNGLFASGITAHSGFLLPGKPQLTALVRALEGQETMAVEQLLAKFDRSHATTLARGLLWLAKYGVVTIRPALPDGG